MQQVTNIKEDKRPIHAVGTVPENDETGYWKVGFRSCTAIVAYEEPGNGAMVPWLAVYIKDELRLRLPGWCCSIEYASSDKD